MGGGISRRSRDARPRQYGSRERDGDQASARSSAQPGAELLLLPQQRRGHRQGARQGRGRILTLPSYESLRREQARRGADPAPWAAGRQRADSSSKQYLRSGDVAAVVA